MTSSTSSSSLAAAVAAVLAPAVIVAAALAWLGRADVTAEAEVDPAVAACLTETGKEGADVALVGNSKSGTDIDRPALARLLGVPHVAKLGAPGSSAPLWYAALERCVYEAGHAPKLVIVYGVGGAILRTTVDSELERLLLAPYLGETEPVLAAKVFGGDPVSPFWGRVRTRKTTMVLGFQHGVRDLVAGLFFAPPGEGDLLARGRAYAEPALATVLGENAGEDAVSRHRAIPIAESGAAAVRERGIDDTLVPDIVALAKAHGSRVVFVQAPLSTAKAETYDKADPTLLRDMVAALNDAGAGFVDLTTLSLPASAYGDGIHMNSNGRGQLTAALGQRLAALDAVTAAAFEAAPLPRVPAKLRRDGAPRALSASGPPKRGQFECGWVLPAKGFEGVSDSTLGRAGMGKVSPLVLFEDGAPLTAHAAKEAFDLACEGAFNHQNAVVKFSPSGGPADVASSRVYTLGLSDAAPLVDPSGREAWWVYPGTTLRADAADGWDPALENFGVHVEAYEAIPGATPATVVWAGGEAPLAVEAGIGTATTYGPSPAGPWSVEVRSPPDGPWLLVQRIVAGTEAAPWHLLGAADEGRTVNVFKGDLTYASEPPAIGVLGRILPAKAGGWRIVTTELGVPDGESTGKASGIQGCSPLVVMEDGTPLAAPNSPLRLIPTTGGAWSHTPFGILFSPSDLTSPLENRRKYTAALNPERACRAGRWLYPGDHATFEVGPALLARLARGATRLDLAAAALGGDPAALLQVSVRAGDAELLAVRARLAGIDTAPPSFTLAAPILPDTPGVTVEVSTEPGAPYVMVSGLTLAEPGRGAFPEAAEAADAAP